MGDRFFVLLPHLDKKQGLISGYNSQMTTISKNVLAMIKLLYNLPLSYLLL